MTAMQPRSLVIGCAGRSRLRAEDPPCRATRRRELGLPLDLPRSRSTGSRGWVEPHEGGMARASCAGLAAEPAWVMDGNYSRHVRPAHAARRHAWSGSTIRARHACGACVLRVHQGTTDARGRICRMDARSSSMRKFLRFVWDFPAEAAGRASSTDLTTLRRAPAASLQLTHDRDAAAFLRDAGAA